MVNSADVMFCSGDRHKREREEEGFWWGKGHKAVKAFPVVEVLPAANSSQFFNVLTLGPGPYW